MTTGPPRCDWGSNLTPSLPERRGMTKSPGGDPELARGRPVRPAGSGRPRSSVRQSEGGTSRRLSSNHALDDGLAWPWHVLRASAQELAGNGASGGRCRSADPPSGAAVLCGRERLVGSVSRRQHDRPPRWCRRAVGRQGPSGARRPLARHHQPAGGRRPLWSAVRHRRTSTANSPNAT